jgi:hypothetical protein
MTLFNKNRQTALVLALVATMLTCSMLVGSAFAGSISGGGDPSLPRDGKGDPDVPTGPAKKTVPGVQRIEVAPSHGPMTVGDGHASYSAWTWRLRIVLRGLRAYTFRY